jgi:hypothetical protein
MISTVYIIGVLITIIPGIIGTVKILANYSEPEVGDWVFGSLVGMLVALVWFITVPLTLFGFAAKKIYEVSTSHRKVRLVKK